MTITAYQKGVARRYGQKLARERKDFKAEVARDYIDIRTGGECDTTELDILVSIARHESVPPTWR